MNDFNVAVLHCELLQRVTKVNMESAFQNDDDCNNNNGVNFINFRSLVQDMEKLREAEENLHQLEMIMTTKVQNKESKERNSDKIEKNHADEVQQLKLQLEVRQPHYNVLITYHCLPHCNETRKDIGNNVFVSMFYWPPNTCAL